MPLNKRKSHHHHARPTHSERHMIARKGILRAGVLGANDGVVSIGALVMGVVAAAQPFHTLALTGVSALAAGAGSMAIGEYVSVASQKDSEQADIDREKIELHEDPEDELAELASIYRHRGLSDELAMKVAVELTEHNVLEAHLRDELGITDIDRARPGQAAYVSFLTFCAGGSLPFLMALISVSIFDSARAPQLGLISLISIAALAILGYFGAKLGGAPIGRSLLRVIGGGTAALVVTSILGSVFA